MAAGSGQARFPSGQAQTAIISFETVVRIVGKDESWKTRPTSIISPNRFPFRHVGDQHPMNMNLKHAIILFAACSICSVPANAAEVDDTSSSMWKPVVSADGSLPVQRHEAAYVGIGDKFFLAGGRRMNPVSIFDPRTRKWTEGAVPPIELHHFQPVVHGKEVYVAGALTGPYPAETPLPHIYIYNTDTDSWNRGADIPLSRLRGSTGNVIYKGKLYMACGIRDGHRGDHKNWFDSYDLSAGEWQRLPDAPRARDHFQAAVCNDRLYLIGGRRSNAPSDVFGNTVAEVDVYDFNAESWSTLDAGIPTQRAGLFLAVVGDDIMVLGGETAGQRQAHNEVEVLNTTTHKWSSLSPMLQGRHGTGAVHFEDSIYVASGCGNRGGSPELTTQEILQLK